MSFGPAITTEIAEELAPKGVWSRVPSAACVDRDLSAGDWRVLVLLCKFADQHGRCFPSQHLLATTLKVRRQVVGRHLTRLQAKGYLRRTIKHRGKRGAWGRTLYTIQYRVFTVAA